MGWTRGDLLWSELHGAWVRFVRWDIPGLLAVVSDREGRELPDYVNVGQLGTVPW